MSKILCLYHANCADGFVAAWVVGKAYGFDNVEFIEAKYGHKPPDLTGRNVVIVDFSYKPEVLLPAIKNAKSVTMIDHHISAMHEWGRVADLPHNLSVHFNIDHSGASFAWALYFPNDPAPRIVNHVRDYDLWKFEINFTKALITSIWASKEFKRRDLSLLTRLEDDEFYNRMIQDGHLILKTQNDIIESMIETGNHRFCKVAGAVRVPVMHVSATLANDSGVQLNRVAAKDLSSRIHFGSKDRMPKGAGSFSATYTENWEGLYRKFSLRSHDAYDYAMDVTKVAGRFGGGGHKASSGFHVPIQVPVHLLFNLNPLVRAYVKTLVWFYTRINKIKRG